MSDVLQERMLVGEEAFVWPTEPWRSGGMAAIFVARDRRLPRHVVIKLPLDSEDQQEALLLESRIKAEADVLARLQHPTIVTLYEVGRRTNGTPFLVLERIEGTSLRQRLDELRASEVRAGSNSNERLALLATLVPVAEALAHAHARNIVHRDIKPDNILLAKHDEPTLIDWGIAKSFDSDMPAPASVSSTKARSPISGTAPYMPREQARREAVSDLDDVYSFGMVLYEVITGSPPFQFSNATSSDDEQLFASFLRWVDQRPDPLPPVSSQDAVLSGIIARATALSRTERYTATELVTALRQYLAGALVFSHNYSVIGRVTRWALRHRVILLVITISMSIAGLTFAGWMTARAQSAEHERSLAQERLDRAKTDADANELRLKNQEAQENVAFLQEVLDSADHELKDAQRRGATNLEEKQRRVDYLQARIQIARTKLTETETALKEAERKAVAAQDKISDVTTKISQAQQLQVDTQTKLSSMEAELASTQAQNKELTRQIHALLDAGVPDALPVDAPTVTTVDDAAGSTAVLKDAVDN